MKAESSNGRKASQTSTRISHAGETTRVTLLCSITAPPPAYSNRQRHPAFTVAIHDQPRTKSTRAAVSTSARTEHRYLKPASRDTNLHKPPQPITSQALRVPHSPCVDRKLCSSNCRCQQCHSASCSQVHSRATTSLPEQQLLHP